MSQAPITSAERQAYIAGKKLSMEVRTHSLGDVVIAYLRNDKGIVIVWGYVMETGTENHRTKISDVKDDERKKAFTELADKGITKKRDAAVREYVLSAEEANLLMA